jgi:hypothetical protein
MQAWTSARRDVEKAQALTYSAADTSRIWAVTPVEMFRLRWAFDAIAKSVEASARIARVSYLRQEGPA